MPFARAISRFLLFFYEPEKYFDHVSFDYTRPMSFFIPRAFIYAILHVCWVAKKIVFIDSRHKCFSIVRSVRNAATGRTPITLFNKPLRIYLVHSSYVSFFIAMTSNFASRGRGGNLGIFPRRFKKTWLRYHFLFASSLSNVI